MVLLLADALVLTGLIFGVRWAAARSVRFVPLAVALAATTAFILTRNRYDLEDSEFLWVLLAFCSGALVGTVAACLLSRERTRAAVLFGALAMALVPIFFVVYIAAALTLCLVTGCDMS